MAAKQNLIIRQGETFLRIIRWETPPFIYKPITAITQAGPAVVTAVGHGLKTGWRAAVVSAGGMTEINAGHSPPREHEYKQGTALSADDVAFNTVNSSEYTAYTAGGYLQFYTPVDLTGYSARMTIKNKIGGTELMLLTSSAPDNRIALDATNYTITLTISAADTTAITWKVGVYDLEMESGAGVVTTIFSGVITVAREVTT